MTAYRFAAIREAALRIRRMVKVICDSVWLRMRVFQARRRLVRHLQHISDDTGRVGTDRRRLPHAQRQKFTRAQLAF